MANLNSLFETLIGSDDKFKSAVIKQIDQQIAIKEKDLEAAKEARNMLMQGQAPIGKIQGRRGRPPGSRNKQEPGAKQTNRDAILSVLKAFPKGATSGEIAEALKKSNHNIDPKVLYVSLYNGVHKNGELRSEGPRKSMKYFLVKT